MTRKEIIALVALASSSYPSIQAKNPESIVASWEMMLEDIPFEIAKPAVIKVCRESEFFPSVAQIVKASKDIDPRHDELPSSAEAWEEVYDKIQYVGQYRSPSFSNNVITRAVNAMGWKALCEGENLEADRAHFLRIYESMRQGANSREESDKALQISGMSEVVKALAEGFSIKRLEEKP